MQEGEGGTNNIDNAIALCFDCHAEIHLYNNKHPRGRKYHPDELRGHKEQWLEICKKSPQIFTEHLEHAEGGPLSGIVTELEFNHIVSKISGCPFEVHQFQRGISDGIISLLDDRLRESIMSAYADIKIANHELERQSTLHPSDPVARENEPFLKQVFRVADQSLKKALDEIHTFLDHK
jgi:hypothetical protein